MSINNYQNILYGRVNIVIENNNHKAICVEISDNGDGIDIDGQNKIFIPHKSNKGRN